MVTAMGFEPTPVFTVGNYKNLHTLTVFPNNNDNLLVWKN